jgi:hypothetical protein
MDFVKVLKLDSHKGTRTTSFFAYTNDGQTIAVAKASKVGLQVGDEVPVADLVKFAKATPDQLKRYESVKSSGVDVSLL